jgi:hypothetical protein
MPIRIEGVDVALARGPSATAGFQRLILCAMLSQKMLIIFAAGSHIHG